LRRSRMAEKSGLGAKPSSSSGTCGAGRKGQGTGVHEDIHAQGAPASGQQHALQRDAPHHNIHSGFGVGGAAPLLCAPKSRTGLPQPCHPPGNGSWCPGAWTCPGPGRWGHRAP
jgi:hypothetical protein